MANINDNYNAATKLYEWYPIVKSNFNLLNTEVDAHIANKNNPHGTTKAQIGLSNVDNTSDADKPISTAAQSKFSELQADINTRATDSALHAHINNTDNPHDVTKADVGLANVDAPDDGYVQIGYGADVNNKTYNGVVIGKNACTNSGIAIGDNAEADLNLPSYAIAIGNNAKATGPDSIQLGNGTNSNSTTFQVYSYQLLDAGGMIPHGRIGQSGTWTPKIVSSTANAPTITYNRQVGDWIRIGNMVWCNFTIWMASFSAGSADGSIVLGGLPFTPYGDLGRILQNTTYTAYLNAASGVTAYEFLQKETNGIALIKRSAGGGGLYCKYASDSGIFNNNTEFAGSLCYRIA